MITTDAQVRKLMEEMARHGRIGQASMRAAMDRKTGRKYMTAGKLPSQLKRDRNWRTREDPFAEVWPEIAERLAAAPELEAKTLFTELHEKDPDRFDEGQLRTFQRKVKQWRATYGPPKEVFFPQEHRPGERAQTDFTWGTKLGITIAGEPHPHLLCHFVLPYSNWEWATVCQSESMAALRRGVQAAVFRLGRVPQIHQTDNSCAATHALPDGGRKYNRDYVALIAHLGMKPATIAVGKKEQNGDVEAANGALKRRLKQHLALRGSCDFETVEDYERWFQQVIEKANKLRNKKLRAELATMKQLQVKRLPEYSELDVRVSNWSTIRIKKTSYSVPSRLIGERVRVRLFDDRLEVFYGGQLREVIERLHGNSGHRINYRHIIWWLVKKQGAFARYKYREDMFPTIIFRRAYDRLREHLSERQADNDYLRILHMAAATMESDVETALDMLLEDDQLPRFELVKVLVDPSQVEIPAMPPLKADLSIYDELLDMEEAAS